MSEEKKRSKKVYSPDFKERAVKVAADLGNVAGASRQLGVGYSLLHGWINAADVARSRGDGLAYSLEEKARTARLERENAALREEVEILKKATAYFAAGHLLRSTPGSKHTARSIP